MYWYPRIMLHAIAISVVMSSSYRADTLEEAARSILREVVREEMRNVLFAIESLGKSLSKATSLDALLTVEEVAKHLNVSEKAVYDWIRKGRLRAVRVASLTRVRCSDITDFLEPINAPSQALSIDEQADKILRGIEIKNR